MTELRIPIKHSILFQIWGKLCNSNKHAIIEIIRMFFRNKGNDPKRKSEIQGETVNKILSIM